MSNDKKDLTKSDLTKIEDLDEYTHEDDPEIDALFENDRLDSSPDDLDMELDSHEFSSTLDDLPSIDSLEDEEISTDLESLSDHEASDVLSEDGTDFEEKTDEHELPDDIYHSDPMENADELNEDENSSYSDQVELDENEQDDLLAEMRNELSGVHDLPSLGSEENPNEPYDEGFENSNEHDQEDITLNESYDESLNEAQSDLEDELEDDLQYQQEEEDENHTDQDDQSNESADEYSSYDEDDGSTSTYENQYEEQESTPSSNNIQGPPEITSEFINSSNNISQLDPPTPRINERIAPETFEELKSFADNLTYGQVRIGGSPAFSIRLSGVYENCKDKVISILKDHALFEDETSIKTGLDLGDLLIAQVSEYSAIFLASKLKPLARDISLDLADEIHASESYERDNKGLTSKKSIFQNKELSFDQKGTKPNIKKIMLYTSDHVAGKVIKNNIGFIHEELKLSDEEKSNYIDFKDSLKEKLINNVKQKAFNIGANAVVSTVFQFYDGEEDDVTYISIQGDAVYLEEE